MAWELIAGAISEGLQVCHRCDQPACVNPAHLFLETVAGNLADRDRKGRAAKGARHYSRTRPERVSRGDGHARSKLTTARVREILRRLAAGETQGALAKELGVLRQVVWRIAHRRTWRHVT